MFDFSTLITDRSKSDLESLKSLLSRPMSQWTSEESSAFWGGEYKGSYDFSDFNRVTACMDYLYQRFTELGYNLSYTKLATFVREDHPPKSVLDIYKSNISVLKNAITVPESTPETPENIEYITMAEANNIEKILQAVEETINRMETTFVACGPAICGGDYL